MKILEMKAISKRFGAIQALSNVDFDLDKGEVHILLGENGAGKSTLVKILSGIHQADSGEIFFEGKKILPRSLVEAQGLGISMVFQELNLVPDLTVAENLLLVNRAEGKLFSSVNRKILKRDADKIFKEFGLLVDVSRTIRELSFAERQMVEIAKALSLNSKIIIMDEPTSALGEEDVKMLFGLIRKLKSKGVSIIYISHRFEEIFEIGDKVTVLRDGERVATHRLSELTKKELIEEMVGRELKDFYPKERISVPDEVLLEVRNLEGARIKGISFKLRKGEILGIAGLAGSGRTELLKSIFGALALKHGEIFLEGKKVRIKKPADAIKLGISFVSEDRKEEGLFLNMALMHNITITQLKGFVRFGFILDKREKKKAGFLVEKLKIVPPLMDRVIESFSGGNQQKAVLAKWWGIKPKLLLLDEPTRGIDLGSKVEIYKLMMEFLKGGGAILFASSELPEILGMADRIIVLYEGRLQGELLRADFSQASLMHLATGGFGNYG